MNKHDLESVKNAAIAAGYTINQVVETEVHWGLDIMDKDNINCYSWNPLDNSDDAFSLAIDLGLSLQQNKAAGDGGREHHCYVQGHRFGKIEYYNCILDGDKESALRWAIVRVASRL